MKTKTPVYADGRIIAYWIRISFLGITLSRRWQDA